jgi:putative hemolysin
MFSRISLELALILILLVANGVFAMTEIAIVSSRAARLKRRARDGDPRAAAALELSENPNDFLSTVQIGITFVGILAGAFGGATIAEQIGARFNTVPWIAPHGEALGVVLTVLAITYLSLIIGELVPKRIALTNPEGIGSRMAPFMRALSRFARPIVWLLTISTSAVMKLLRIRSSAEPSVTEEEVTTMVELGRNTGEFHPAEEEMIRGVFALGDRVARGIMTPRHEVVWIDLTQPSETVAQQMITAGFSRYPAADGDLDRLLGLVEIRDLAARCITATPLDFRSIVREPLVVYENTSALQILHEFRSRKTDFAVVVDEYGGVEGIVTMSDLATRVLGFDDDDPEITQREDGSWLVDAMMNFEQLAKQLDLRVDEPAQYDTVAGFLLTRLGGRLPRVAEAVTTEGFRFEIVDMDGRRIDKVLVMRSKENEPLVL